MLGDAQVHAHCDNYEAPSDEDYEGHRESIGLDELEAAAPDQNPQDDEYYRHTSIEQRRRSDERSAARHPSSTPLRAERIGRFWSQLYLHSHVIFFSILGVLARLGLLALTTYPGAPRATPVVWANVCGSLDMGYLREDRMLFRRHWNAARTKIMTTRQQNVGEEASSD